MNTINTIKIKVSNPEPLKLNFDDKIVLKYVSLDHDKLHKLDYESSGHTGFMPAKLSLLPEIEENIPNDRLTLSIYDSEEQTASKIGLSELAKRIITTSDSTSESLQKGQYLFLEIK